MREIKFRGWNKRYNRMDRDFIHLELNKSYTKYHDLILMQYAGIKDKNGVEIYEGDICKSVLIPKTLYVSEFSEGCFMFREYPQIDDWIGRITNCELEIIGNIYENKELLS